MRNDTILVVVLEDQEKDCAKTHLLRQNVCGNSISRAQFSFCPTAFSKTASTCPA